MSRIAVLTEALAQAWLHDEPDGLLYAELMKEVRTQGK